jgi:hypothetical protein
MNVKSKKNQEKARARMIKNLEKHAKKSGVVATGKGKDKVLTKTLDDRFVEDGVIGFWSAVKIWLKERKWMRKTVKLRRVLPADAGYADAPYGMRVHMMQDKYGCETYDRTEEMMKDSGLTVMEGGKKL